MPIYMTERSVSIKAPAVYCDGCGSSLDLVGELVDFNVVRTTERASVSMMYGQLYEVPGIPATEEKSIAAAVERGWKHEDVHGKPMMFCPICSQKPTVERIQPDGAAKPTEAKP